MGSILDNQITLTVNRKGSKPPRRRLGIPLSLDFLYEDEFRKAIAMNLPRDYNSRLRPLSPVVVNNPVGRFDEMLSRATGEECFKYP